MSAIVIREQVIRINLDHVRRLGELPEEVTIIGLVPSHHALSRTRGQSTVSNPFNSPRDPALPPYHLRNGVAERAEIDRHEAEHRRRLGMSTGRERFDAWIKSQWGCAPPTSDVQLAMWLAWQAAQR